MHSAAWTIAKPMAYAKTGSIGSPNSTQNYYLLMGECHSDERISVHGDWHSDERIFRYLLEPLDVTKKSIASCIC